MRFRPLILAAAITLALPAMAQQAAAPNPASGENERPSSHVPLEEIRYFVSIYNAIREAYVEPVEDQKLMRSALRGLLLDLDPHSVYFDAEAAKDFDEDTTGAYEGVGVELQQQPGPLLKIIAPLEGGPAERAGLRSGDIITAIDGKPINNETGSTPLRGVAGSEVKVTVHREGREPFEVSLKRERIQLQSVRSRMLAPGFGYLRISRFQTDTGEAFGKALAELKTEAGGNLQGLVLDLRGNPGGLLGPAVKIADDLLDQGLIVSTRGRMKSSDIRNHAKPGDLLAGAPIMVLVDAGSASASEVLAGALRDNQRARVIGSRTFGKGSVQSFLPLPNGDAVKLTTARYYTPSGRSIQGVGIEPDVILMPEGETARNRYNEASLPRHLQGEDEPKTAMAGENAGHVLPGDAPIQSALAELKKPGSVAQPISDKN
ncbi:peptidase S41 [Lysobacteraceae bacterium NML120232]|nr:peptidase S41 [Xanthomonadaceae bacterium NML120232]